MPRERAQQLRESRHRLEGAPSAGERCDADRERAEQDAKALDHFVDQLVQTMPDAFCFLDRDLIYRRVNPTYAQIFGRTIADFLGKAIFEVFQGTEEQLAGILRDLLASGRPSHAERFPFTYTDAEGVHQTHWDVRFLPLKAEDGSVMGIAVHAVEISERLRLEEDRNRLARQNRELSEGQEELERLRHLQRHGFEFMVQNVEDYAIFMLDPEGRVMSWNAGSERISGYSEAEVLGQEHTIFYPSEDAATGKPMQLLEAAIAEGSVEDDGWRVRKSGERFWAHSAVTAVRDEHTLLGFVSVVRDMTEPRRIEAIERELAALGKLDRMKDDFLSVISHELRTPLNFITGFASILDDEVAGPLNPTQHDYVKKVLNGADRMLFHVNNLVEMSRLSAGKLSLHPAHTDYAGLIAHVLAVLGPLAENKRIGLATDVQVEGEVLLDGQRISQVISNLVDNAIKFTPEGGCVAIKAYAEGDRLVTEVADTGIGIAADDLPKIFQRFVQLDMTSTRTVGGTGLGLAICKSIVEAHGGSIGVRSEGTGHGSTFWFTLPLARGDGAD